MSVILKRKLNDPYIFLENAYRIFVNKYEVLQLTVNIKYASIHCGILTYVQIPKFIRSTHYVLNIEDNVQYCVCEIFLLQ